MFLSYEVMTTFGVSALLSFILSVTVLLIVATKRGLFRVGAKSKMSNLGAILLLPPDAKATVDTKTPPAPVEMVPLSPETA